MKCKLESAGYHNEPFIRCLLPDGVNDRDFAKSLYHIVQNALTDPKVKNGMTVGMSFTTADSVPLPKILISFVNEYGCEYKQSFSLINNESGSYCVMEIDPIRIDFSILNLIKLLFLTGIEINKLDIINIKTRYKMQSIQYAINEIRNSICAWSAKYADADVYNRDEQFRIEYEFLQAYILDPFMQLKPPTPRIDQLLGIMIDELVRAGLISYASDLVSRIRNDELKFNIGKLALERFKLIDFTTYVLSLIQDSQKHEQLNRLLCGEKAEILLGQAPPSDETAKQRFARYTEIVSLCITSGTAHHLNNLHNLCLELSGNSLTVVSDEDGALDFGKFQDPVMFMRILRYFSTQIKQLSAENSASAAQQNTNSSVISPNNAGLVFSKHKELPAASAVKNDRMSPKRPTTVKINLVKTSLS